MFATMNMPLFWWLNQLETAQNDLIGKPHIIRNKVYYLSYVKTWFLFLDDIRTQSHVPIAKRKMSLNTGMFDLLSLHI